MAHLFTNTEVHDAAASLLEWFSCHKRALPWRVHYTPYEVWISEVMLQQTQMDRGVAYFQRWMNRFPSVREVAEASEEEILLYWEGLGYYRRARFLHQAAKVIWERYSGEIPCSQKELSALPGIGAYTVAAILGIAYQQNIVTIDANVERVFSRLLDIETPVKKNPAAAIIQQEAQRFLPLGHARDYNQALMELGALVCGRSPQCDQCPLRSWCIAHRRGVERERPAAVSRPEYIPVTSVHGILVCEKQVLLFQRPAEGLWGNMWEFPGTVMSGKDFQKTLLETWHAAGVDVEIIAPLGTVHHNYTNHKLTAHFFRVAAEGLTAAGVSQLLKTVPHRFIPWNSIGDIAMPAHHRKMAERYFFGKNRIHAEQLTLS